MTAMFQSIHFIHFCLKVFLANYSYLLSDLLIDVRVLNKEGIPASWILIDLQLIHLDSQQLLSIPGSFKISHGVYIVIDRQILVIFFSLLCQ